ncbi:hypothetical protein FOA52_014671 [Chlamydomonas sp. UWO 241]|nr:hypothetical protein FOA52_014671 [Chlamydomonas sp. UWO 241]
MRALAPICAPCVVARPVRVAAISRQTQGLRQLKQTPAVATRTQQGPRDVRVAFFGLGGETSQSAGVYGSQATRDEFFACDVEDYFNYKGCHCNEATYDRMFLWSEGRDAIDTILLFAAEENDVPKLDEILKAGGDPCVACPDGRTAVELATAPDAIELIQSYLNKKAVPA